MKTAGPLLTQPGTQSGSGPGKSVVGFKPRTVEKPGIPTLKFSPYAWAKFKYLCAKGDTEVGAFGISASDDPLYLEDIIMVKQTCTSASVDFDDIAIADFFDDQDLAGRHPNQYCRIWLHTHPGSSATPSYVDEETFKRVFGDCDWAIMVVLAKQGAITARLQINAGVKVSVEVKTTIDYTKPFQGSDQIAWDNEYDSTLTKQVIVAQKWQGARGFGTYVSPYGNGIYYPGGRGINIHNQSALMDMNDIDLVTDADFTEIDKTDNYIRIPLCQELEKHDKETQAEYLRTWQIGEHEIDDYVCYTDENNLIHIELRDDLFEDDEDDDLDLWEVVNDHSATRASTGFKQSTKSGETNNDN